MEISDDFAREYRGATEPDDRGDCPGADELTALAEGVLDDSRRGELADHLVGCSACAAEVRVAREAMAFLDGVGAPATGPADVAPAVAVEARVPTELDDPVGPPLPVRGRVAPRRRSGRLRSQWLGLAAMLLMASGLWWLRSPSTPPGAGDAVRSASSSEVNSEVTPAPGDVLAAAPAVLAWPSQPGAEGYRVEILDSAARPLWRSVWLEESSSPLPPELVDGFAAGSYLWRVEVRGPTAQRELGPYAFSVAAAVDGAP